jgi:hypothetical protein
MGAAITGRAIWLFRVSIIDMVISLEDESVG